MMKPALCWLATASTGVLILAWVLSIWCSMRWTCASGRWVEIADGRISGGFISTAATEWTDFDILARKGPVQLRWGFDWAERPLAWAIPIWAPLLLAAGVGAWAWRGGEAYSR
jgi:hypothetical protein